MHRRGAICIIINNPDNDEDSKQYNNLTSYSTDSDSQDDDNDSDFDDTDNDGGSSDYETVTMRRGSNNIDYTYVKNKKLNAHKRKANRKYNKNRKLKMKLKSPSTAVVVGTDVQVHPKQLNFWQNLLVTQKRRQRRTTMKAASKTMSKPYSSAPNAGNRSTRFIDFFRRRSSRDIHRISGEG